MRGLGQLIDGTNPADIGTAIEYDHDVERYESLIDHVDGHEDKTTIAWFAAGGAGSLLRMTPEEAESWRLPAGTAGVIEWTDGDEDDAETSLRAVTADQVERITRDNECVAVDRIITHYAEHGEDDHPACELYRIHKRWKDAVQPKLAASRTAGSDTGTGGGTSEGKGAV